MEDLTSVQIADEKARAGVERAEKAARERVQKAEKIAREKVLKARRAERQKAEKVKKTAQEKTEKAQFAAMQKLERAEKAENAAILKAEKTEKPKSPTAEAHIRSCIEARLETLMGGDSFFETPKNIQDIADGTGISRAAIRKYTLCTRGGSDSAVPSAVALCKIADYFGVSPNYLLGYSEQNETEGTLRELDSLVRLCGLRRETVKKLITLTERADKSEVADTALKTLDSVLYAAACEILHE